MQLFTPSNIKFYHISDNSQNNEIIIHKNQTDIYTFLKPKQLTIYDFL